MVRLAFIGFGEAAFEMSCGFRSENRQMEIKAFDIAYKSRPDFFRERANKANVTLVESLEELIQDTDAVISVVPTAYTLSTAREALKYFKSGQLFADASTSLPNDMIKIATLAKEKNIVFTDVAMLGSLPKDKHKVPILVSGEGAERFYNLMSPEGMVIEKVNGKAGDASSIKMTRSIFMKGLSTLITETLLCAYKNNIEEYIVNSISESLDGEKFAITANRLVTGNVLHSERRIHEMEGVVQFIKESGLSPIMSVATKKSLEDFNSLNLKDHFSEVKPKEYSEVIRATLEKIKLNREGFELCLNQ